MDALFWQFIGAIDVIIVAAFALWLVAQQREIGDLRERIARLESNQNITVNVPEQQ